MHQLNIQEQLNNKISLYWVHNQSCHIPFFSQLSVVSTSKSLHNKEASVVTKLIKKKKTHGTYTTHWISHKGSKYLVFQFSCSAPSITLTEKIEKENTTRQLNETKHSLK